MKKYVSKTGLIVDYVKEVVLKQKDGREIVEAVLCANNEIFEKNYFYENYRPLLKPCPFCGSDVVIVQSDGRYYIKCCSASVGGFGIFSGSLE